MRICNIHTTGSIQETFMQAKVSCNPLFTRAFNKSLQEAKDLATGTAPIYVRSRWPRFFRKFAHHWTPTGTLKSRMYTRNFNSRIGGRLFIGELGNTAPFASYVENGVRKHNLTHRQVKGKKFMDTAVKVAFGDSLGRNLDDALVEIFGGKR